MNDASASGWVIDATEQDFEEEVLHRSKETPVIVDFWAPWCQPCRLLSPLLEAQAQERAGAFVVAKVNVDECPNLAGYFQVEGIPAVHVIRDGQYYPGFQGLLSEQELRGFIDGIFPSEAEKTLKEALDLETTDPAKAETLYRKFRSADPDHELGRLGLARLLVAKRQYAEAKELLAPLGVIGDIGAEAERLMRTIEVEGEAVPRGDETALRAKIALDPENALVRYELGSVLAAQGKYPDALEMLLSAAEREKKLAQNEVRELMVKIFQIIGVRSELADDYRARLQSLLY